MSVFVTVGSTGFDELIYETTKHEFLDNLSRLNIKRVVFQYGTSEPVFFENIQAYEGSTMQVEGYKYKPSTTNDILEANIVISHAGSGTMLQVLRLGDRKLIMVVNKSLLDNHQLELAETMHKKKYAICSDISDLGFTIQSIQQFIPKAFPKANSKIFKNTVDSHMGF
ncbi:glycosyl transferase [Sporodiniella umbellata]|nr:glycosyl transferase [Sporodiniella umbellata]